MLYLAEVKKQTKGLISGLKTELKLLACQEKDQAWTPVTGEETISCDYLSYVGEGALLLVNLNGNKQVQGTPELAGNRLVRQLQYFSRLLEKSKQQEEDIEQWRQSLTIQSQELNRRREEINAQLEEIERKAQEFENLEEQRQEIQEAWDKLQVEEQRYSESNSQQSMIIA